MSIRSIVATAVCAASAWGYSSAGDTPGDQAVTTFYLPGQFKEAVEKSIAENKPLLIKGYNQIVDDIALTDPNKGHC